MVVVVVVSFLVTASLYDPSVIMVFPSCLVVMLEGSFVSVEGSTTLVVVSSTVVDVDVPSSIFFSYFVVTVVFSVFPSEGAVDTVGCFCMVPGFVESRASFATFCSGVRFSCEPDVVSAVLSPPSEVAVAPDAAFSVPAADISGAAVFIAAGAAPSPPSDCTVPLVADVVPSPLDTEGAPSAVFAAGAGAADSALGAEGAPSAVFAAGAGAADSALGAEGALSAVFTAGAGAADSALGAEGALSVEFAAGAGAGAGSLFALPPSFPDGSGAGSLFCSTWMTVSCCSTDVLPPVSIPADWLSSPFSAANTLISPNAVAPPTASPAAMTLFASLDIFPVFSLLS